MNVLEVKDQSDRITLRFESASNDINAYSLASALVGLADAVREANAAINAGYRVEVVVEALSEGSFQATVRTVFTSAKNLFASQAAQAIIFGIISTHIYEKFIKAEDPVKVTESEELVVIESGKQKLLSRERFTRQRSSWKTIKNLTRRLVKSSLRRRQINVLLG